MPNAYAKFEAYLIMSVLLFANVSGCICHEINEEKLITRKLKRFIVTKVAKGILLIRLSNSN